MYPMSTRRHFLGQAATTLAAGWHAARSAAAPAAGPQSPDASSLPPMQCLPVTRGHLRPYDHAFTLAHGRDGWLRELDDERRIGAQLLWLSHIAPGLDETGADPLRIILDACQERGMSAMLETGHTPQWYVHRDLDRERAELHRVCRLLAERYGDHPAFQAVYLNYEIYMAWDGDDSPVDKAYLDALFPVAVAACKTALPDKPVAVSPFFILDRDRVFGAFRYAEPEEYGAYWAQLIRRSGLDRVMLQDSGEHFSFSTLEQRRPFFAAMQAACRDAGAAFWGNVETAEMRCESMEQYIALYGRVHHSQAKGIPWRNVPLDRLVEKLRLAAGYCENIVSWGYYQMGRPHLGPDAQAWYEQYRAYYDSVVQSGNA